MQSVTRFLLDVPLFGLVACFLTVLPAEPGEGGPATAAPPPDGPRREPAPLPSLRVLPPPLPPPPLPPLPPGRSGRASGALEATPGEARSLLAFRPFVLGVLRRCRVPEGDLAAVAQGVLLQILPWWKGRCRAAEATGRAARRDAGHAYVHVVSVRSAKRHRSREWRHWREQGWDPDRVGAGDNQARCPEAVSPSPEEQWLELEAAAERLRETDLERLGGATRPAFWRAFYAHEVIGASVARIAEAERVPVATIYTRLRLARRDLRAAILRHRAAHRPA